MTWAVKIFIYLVFFSVTIFFVVDPSFLEREDWVIGLLAPFYRFNF